MQASIEPLADDRRGVASDRKGCLKLYGLWIAAVAVFVGVVFATGGGAEGAAFFAILLLPVPALVAAGHAHGERLLARAATKLGFGIRRVSWRKGERPEPVFDFEPSDRDWFFDLLEGTRDGAEAVAYAAMATRGAWRGTPHKALGVVWGLPYAGIPRLVVHGPTVNRVLLPAQDASGRRVDALSVHPPVAPPSPVPGFERTFSSFGETGAELLLTEAVQKALLALPRRSRLLVEGSRLRWEVEVGPFARGLGRRAEELLERTIPLREALHEASALSARANPTGR